MKRKTSLILCAVMIFSMIFSLTGCFAENDYARIVDVDYTAKVIDAPGSDGKVLVTERITFDVHAASQWNGFWELWRDLVEREVDGVKVYYDVKSVKQILSDGREIMWAESPKLYWDDYDYVSENEKYGPNKWYHSPGPYNEAARRYECLLLYVDNLYRGEYTFEIEYEMYNAVLRYGDSSDIYIPMYSGEGLKHLESFSGQVLIPKDKMPSEDNYKVVTYGTKGGDFPIEESATKNPGYYTFYFNLDEKDLKFTPSTSFIEFDLVAYGEDKHSFAHHTLINDYYHDDILDEIFKTQDKFFLSIKLGEIFRVVLLFVGILLSYIVIKKARNKTKEFDERWQKSIVDYDKITFRDIPNDLDPNFAASFVFCRSFKNAKEDGIYSAILLSLARKKYVEIEEKGANNVRIHLLEPEKPEIEPIAVFNDGDFEWYQPKPADTREPLTESEELYLNLIKRHVKKGSISLDTLQNRIFYDTDYTRNFANKIKKSFMDIGINLNYLKNSNYLGTKTKLSGLSGKWLALGIVMLFVCHIAYGTAIQLAFGGLPLFTFACFYNYIYLRRMSKKYVVLTDKGEEEYRKWRGLYNFLNSDTLINEKRVIELPLWEKYLVYATAFGISEKVIDAIKIHCNENAMSQSYGIGRYSTSIVHNSYCRSGRIRSYGSSFHSSVRSSSIGHSSSFGGGGYYGGGRGGGYGGGGH